MPNKNTNTTLLILTILLCLVVVGLGVYTYSFYNEVQESKNQLIKDKALFKAELDEEISRYGELLKENSGLSLELVKAKERLEGLQRKIDSNTVTRSIVRQYQLELKKLRREREVLFKQNDSLQQETRRLSDLQERTQNRLDSITKERDKEQVVAPQKINISVKSNVTISNLQAYGVIQRNSGKFVNTSRAGRAQMVRLCFEVDASKNGGDRQVSFFVRVLNESKGLIGIERFVTLDTGNKLSYNTETKIQYKGQTHRVCELVLPVKTFSKGTYIVEVFSTQGLLDTTQLTLK